MVFDLEAIADRADPRKHDIIEIGAILASRNQVLDEFQTLVRPTRSLGDHSRQLAGIDEFHLQEAPNIESALRNFYRFSGNRPLIAHNGFGYDFLLLDAASSKLAIIPPPTLRLDTLELAHLVFPRAGKGMIRHSDKRIPPPGRSLDDLVNIFFGNDPRQLHRALEDARLTHQVLVHMLQRLDQDAPIFNLQRWILGVGDHPWAKFLQPHHEPVQLQDVIPPPSTPRRPEPTGRFDISAVTGMFEDGGVLMQQAREPRAQQIEMTRLCSQALSGEGFPLLNKGLLIEAPTGTGKTLAYLTPAIEYARASGQTVIVAPHSKVLQNQILSTLEEMADDLEDFNFVLLKGRANYLSLESLAAELDTLESHPEASSGEAENNVPNASLSLALAVICGWVALTPTGDWDDLRTWAIERHVPELRRLRRLLRGDDLPPAPNHPLARLDFYRRALDGVKNAHVAVFNHALLVTKDDWIGRTKYLIVDEAHNLEDSATNALSVEVDDETLLTLCSALWDPVHRRGTAHRIAAATRVSLQSERIRHLRQAANTARQAINAFRSPLVDFLRDRTGALQEEAARYPMSYRIRPGIDTRRAAYRKVREPGKRLCMALLKIADALNEIVIPEELHGRYRQRRLEAEIVRIGREARKASQVMGKVLSAREPESWINIGEVRFADDAWRWKLRRAPVSVDSQLRALWGSLTSFVLTSATLSVNGSFGHILSTLGLDSAQTKALGNPFPRLSENHLVILTDYLPSPRRRSMEEFRNSAASEIPRLLTLTGGRGMILMTARARMEFVRDHARPILESEGLPLLAQGDAPSPALVERMRAGRTTSLLALRSFWEGIDVPGEALSLLAIEKTPFDSPADPIVGARMEIMERRGKDPFANYMVPRAALRFAQGVGRLIRTATDRGVTVVLDNRLRRPTPYRDRILRTLPGPPTFKKVDKPDEAYRKIADHLEDVSFDQNMRKRLDAIPSADPWADLEGLRLTEEEMADETVIRVRLEQVRERFGFAEWRPGQLETMIRFMRGEDVLAVLPTGSGKSITFQIPALLSPGVTLVISPLTALMNDQTENLRSHRITQVATIHGGVSQSEQAEILRGARSGRYKLLYVSPERLWSPLFIHNAQEIDLARVAVDEAHCISQWGHSFRTEYAAVPRALNELCSRRLPRLAATATATPRVREEIINLLGLNLAGPPVILSPDRPEIRYHLERCKDFKDRDLRVVQVVEAFRRQSAIVYAPTRADTTRLAGLLRSAGQVVRPYHGKMEHSERQHVEDAFRHGEIDVVVATKAFGMGIDKPDIVLILHLEMPASIEEYIQETGRVARGANDGVGPETGTAVLLVTPRDCRIHQYFARSAATDLSQVKFLWAELPVGQRPFNPDTFIHKLRGEDASYKKPDRLQTGSERDRQGIALAVSYLETEGALRRHRDIVWKGRISTVADTPEMIRELEESDPGLAERAREIIRTLDQIGSEDYHAETWGKRLGRNPREIETDLLELRRRDILGFAVWRYAWMLERKPGEPDWEKVERTITERREAVERRSRQARCLTRGQHRCRREVMLNHLGIETNDICGGCDACTPDLPRPWADSEITQEHLIESIPMRSIILQLLSDIEGLNISRRNIVRALTGEEGRRFSLPDSLLNHPAYGQLYFLGTDRVNKVIDTLIEDELVIEERAEHNRTKYSTLALREAKYHLATGDQWPS